MKNEHPSNTSQDYDRKHGKDHIASTSHCVRRSRCANVAILVVIVVMHFCSAPQFEPRFSALRLLTTWRLRLLLRRDLWLCLERLGHVVGNFQGQRAVAGVARGGQRLA